MSEATTATNPDDLSDAADRELPEIQREVQAWLLANNTSDQGVIVAMASVLGIGGAVLGLWWAVAIAGCLLSLLPLRWLATPRFARGDVREGLLITMVGTWGITIPLVLLVPDTLAIAMQNVIGALILAAAYLEQRLVKRLIPAGLALAALLGFIGYRFDGVGLDDDAPSWLYFPVLIAYLVANLMLVLNDVQESNRVRLRLLRRAVVNNRELREADAALRESRRRLLVAADEERVRVERNLHDGAQQRLVSLSVQLRLAAELAEEGNAPTSEALHALHEEAVEAVEELRELAQGLYPARLHELGLVGALRSVARRSPVHVELVDRTSGALDQSTENALYFMCLEAIQNATKHGQSVSQVTVELVDEGDDLVVRIVDDGPGFDVHAHAHSRGLLNMADRVGALGGDFDIDSAPGSGTTITARLPMATPAAVA